MFQAIILVFTLPFGNTYVSRYGTGHYFFENGQLFSRISYFLILWVLFSTVLYVNKHVRQFCEKFRRTNISYIIEAMTGFFNTQFAFQKINQNLNQYGC